MFTHLIFSLENKTGHTIESVKALLIIRNRLGGVIDFSTEHFRYLGIPPGLVKQVAIRHTVYGCGADTTKTMCARDRVAGRFEF